ncbi:hypothetical protein M2352_002385 [Azospirillum fermentarium]|uniref:flagellar basal body-associated FliL family protein n=1 Tax=Azospirillum fermentarium TaxID=1233114 RepID=UPI0022270E75|nr:flagellar basal body-associated FliL family protein [Azospirillum fermentarium]MCW2246794.1 hypothetical protein [Azospirillum fermentarium]
MSVRSLLRTVLVAAALAMIGVAQPAEAVRTNSISFPDLLLPTERDGILTGNARFQVTLELSSPRVLKVADGRRAQIQDAIVSVLFTAMGERLIVNGGIENGAELRRRLDEAAERITGAGTVMRVLVFSVPQKP